MAVNRQRQSAKRGAQAPADTWRNRIVGHGSEAPDQLLANPDNWRIHPQNQQDALAGALDSVGWIDEVTVNQRTGFVVDGHLRAALAISRGEKSVPVRYVDLSPEEEALVLASKDPIAALAVTDQEKLNALLGDVDVANQALDQMLYALLEDANKTSLQDTQESQDDAEPEDRRKLGDPKAQIKPVLYADQVAIFEQAIRMTGERNRGKAIIEICRAYVERAERQLDVLAESAVA